MHGGKIYLRTKNLPKDLPGQIAVKKANTSDMLKINDYINFYSDTFNIDKNKILSEEFYVLIPDTNNPYKQLYTYN